MSASGSLAISARMTARRTSASRSPPAQRSWARSSARRRTGRRPFGRVQVDVARGHREAIGFANRRARDDLCADGQVAGHLADDHDLLGVLLAEVGPLGADQPEQDRDDRGDAVEVTRTRRTLQRFRDAPTDTVVSEPGGKTMSTGGAKTRSTPATSHTARSRASLRGYWVKSAATLNWRGLTKIETTARRRSGGLASARSARRGRRAARPSSGRGRSGVGGPERVASSTRVTRACGSIGRSNDFAWAITYRDRAGFRRRKRAARPVRESASEDLASTPSSIRVDSASSANVLVATSTG